MSDTACIYRYRMTDRGRLCGRLEADHCPAKGDAAGPQHADACKLNTDFDVPGVKRRRMVHHVFHRGRTAGGSQ